MIRAVRKLWIRMPQCTSKAYGQTARLFNVVCLLACLLACEMLAAMLAVPAHAGEQPLRLVAYGDSLTAGPGLSVSDTFPAQLERALKETGATAIVLDAGVSGDTTAGGRARLDWTLADKPDGVILCLGANDALRGLDPATTYENLDAMLTKLAANRIPVLLAGMRAPANLGRDYVDSFASIFPRLAEKFGVPLYPFFLDGVAAKPELNLSDGIHPNKAGVAVIVERMTPYVVRLLNSAAERD